MRKIRQLLVQDVKARKRKEKNMLFAIMCFDKENHLEQRLKARPDHLAFLHALGERLKAAGPFLNDAEKPNGSLLIIEGETREEIENLLKNDPYVKADLFENVYISKWNWAIKNPENK
jgi:uncharacterized protein